MRKNRIEADAWQRRAYNGGQTALLRVYSHTCYEKCSAYRDRCRHRDHSRAHRDERLSGGKFAAGATAVIGGTGYQPRVGGGGFVARRAAPAIGDADIVWLEDNLDALQSALTCSELDEAAQLDFAFHMRIVSLAGNTAIESILRGS